MNLVNFEVAKKIKETFSNKSISTINPNCEYLYGIDNQQLMWFGEQIADPYLKDSNSYYPAFYIWDVIDFLEKEYKWSIYITPRFDGFDNAQIDTYFEIYKSGKSGGRDYSLDAHVGSRYESANRAIIEVCDLIKNERNDGIYN